MVYAMPVLRVVEAWRLSVDTSARVTLALRVTPSGEEGVGASASSVSRLCPNTCCAYAYSHVVQSITARGRSVSAGARRRH